MKTGQHLSAYESSRGCLSLSILVELINDAEKTKSRIFASESIFDSLFLFKGERTDWTDAVQQMC